MAIPPEDRAIARLALCVAVVATVGASAACASGTSSGGRTRTVTVNPGGQTTTSASSAPATATVTVTATASGSASGTETSLPPPPPHQTKLPGTCDSLLSLGVVESAIGTDVPGRTEFVVGTAEADIHRLAYINCRYGLPQTKSPAAVPLVEIGVSLYSAASYATRRVAATIDDYSANGATAKTVDISGREGTILTGGVGTGYDVPLLVAASGQRTIAINLAESVGDDASRTEAFTALAKVVVVKTGG